MISERFYRSKHEVHKGVIKDNFRKYLGHTQNLKKMNLMFLYSSISFNFKDTTCTLLL